MKPNHSLIVRTACALAVAVCAANPAKADYSSTVLSQNPVAYYRLNETTPPAFSHATNSGSLGAVADGSYSNLPSLNLTGPFAGSVSLGLDGLSQYVLTPWSANLNPATFTFELWAKPATVPNFAYLASAAELNSPRSGWYFAQDNGSTFGYGPAWVVRFFNTNAATPSVTLHVTNASAAWIDFAFTYDGSVAKLYTNGVLADTETPTHNGAGLGYVPDVDGPFTVGIRSSLNFPWPGQVAEAAIYPSALSAARITAHFTAATTAPATYASTVLSDSPVVYDRYQAPPQPIAANSGTLASAGDGLYVGDVVPGAPGPQPSRYPGFDAANKAPAFDAGGGAVRLPSFNLNTNTITISGWINASNAQSVAAGIVVCDAGTTYAGLTIDGLNGGLGLGYVWNNDINTYNWSPTSDAGLPQLPDSDWAYVALVIQPTEADIYIALTNNGASFTGVTNYFNHVNQAFDGPTLVGTDASNPTYSFNGAIDEIGIWNRSLSSGDLYSQYASAVGGLKPIIFGDPPSPSQPIVAGDTLTLTVNVGGTPILSYLWLSNSVPIAWATNSILNVSNFDIAANSGSYSVIVTNLYGAATSGVAVVTGQIATAPVILSTPLPTATVYPGGVLNLAVGATGGGLKFQWKLAGTNLPGATDPLYAVPVVTNVNGGSYTLTITNSLGSTNLGPFVVTVPSLLAGTYAAVVDADAPVSWWRLDDPVATNGAVLADVMGRHYGAYTNNGGLTVGVPGAITGGLAGTAAYFNGDGSYGYVPYFPELSSTTLSIELWGRQDTEVDGVTLVSSFDSSGDGFGARVGGQWQGQNGGGTFGQPAGSQASGNPNWDPTVRSGHWVHIVIIYNPGSSATYPYQIWINGATDGYIWGNGGTPLNNSSPFIIGGKGTGLASILKENYVGYVDEVAFYKKALTSTQIQAHYAAAFYGVPPTYSVQPQSQNAFAGQNVTLSATAVGAPPIGLQWKKNNVSISGETNSTLSLSNLYYTTSSDVYTVLATNLYGTNLSSPAIITVYYPPTYANLTNGLVLHLKFDGDYTDSSGHGNNGTAVGAPTLVAGKIGSQAVTVLTDTTNGIYDYVTLGNPTDFQFGASVDFSVTYWVKFPPGLAPGDLPFFCSAANSTGGFGLTLAPAYKTGGWAWSLDNSSSVGAGVQGPANTINDGAWHNVVETFTRTGNCVTYVDGLNVSSVSIAGIGNVDSGGPFNIGQDPTGTYGESGTYSLDDIGVWRRALTEMEARSIYQVGQNLGKSFDTFGPVTLSMVPLTAGKQGIAWQAGTLQQANTLLGPWTPVAGATPPLYQFTPSSTNTFYRISL